MMKKNILIFKAIILFIIFNYSFCMGLGFGNYESKKFNYRIIIPNSWKKVVLNLKDKHYMYVTKDDNIEIKVIAFKASSFNIDMIAHKKRWDLRKIDPRLNEIIETKKIKIKKNTVGKLLVFEYRSNKKDFLQRIIITTNNEITYIVECKSPVKNFYQYEDTFTTALASFTYLKKTGQQGGLKSTDEIGDDEWEEEEGEELNKEVVSDEDEVSIEEKDIEDEPEDLI